MARSSSANSHVRLAARRGRPGRGVVLLVIAVALVSLSFKTPLTAGFSRAPRVVHVGSGWGREYVAIPQRASTPPQTRKAQGDSAALLARQRGVAIVAAGNVADVVVVDKDGGVK